MNMRFATSLQNEIDIEYIKSLVEEKLKKLKQEKNAYKHAHEIVLKNSKLFQEHIFEELHRLRKENEDLRKQLTSKK